MYRYVNYNCGTCNVICQYTHSKINSLPTILWIFSDRKSSTHRRIGLTRKPMTRNYVTSSPHAQTLTLLPDHIHISSTYFGNEQSTSELVTHQPVYTIHQSQSLNTIHERSSKASTTPNTLLTTREANHRLQERSTIATAYLDSSSTNKVQSNKGQTAYQRMTSTSMSPITTRPRSPQESTISKYVFILLLTKPFFSNYSVD